MELLRGNFGDLDRLLTSVEVPGIDAILFDLGVSSVQIDTPSRGFSFKENGPLDMRMDPGKQTLNAAEIVNTYNAADLTRVIRAYSDEKWASRIAEFVVKAREKAPIETSAQLVDIVKAAIPASARRAGGHPAKRTFQALRIEVNSELDVLSSGLEAAVRWLNPGGRLVVISYHSLEDRIVKDLFNSYANRCTCPPDLPVCMCGKQPILDIVTRKPSWRPPRKWRATRVPAAPSCASRASASAGAGAAKRKTAQTQPKHSKGGQAMGAQPAYRYSERAYERPVERAPRIRVVPGTGPAAAPSALPVSVVFLAKVAAAVLLVVALVGVARVALSSAAVTGSLQAQELSGKIDSARAQGNQLEVAQSSLSNPARVKTEATAAGMAAPLETTTIELGQDVVGIDEAGNLSLSQSLRLAAAS